MIKGEACHKHLFFTTSEGPDFANDSLVSYVTEDSRILTGLTYLHPDRGALTLGIDCNPQTHHLCLGP